jgi:NADH dehydrogenase/NADH:ubiquinone oxidoreductase subunit G
MIPLDLKISSVKVENFKKDVEVFKKGEKSLEDVTSLFKSMKISEKDRVVKELSEGFKKLPEKAKKQIKELLQNEELFNHHVTIKASRNILLAQFIDNLETRKAHLIDSIKNLKFYKVLHLRRVFNMLKEINPDKKALTDILKIYQHRFNPLTIARLNEFIEIPLNKEKEEELGNKKEEVKEKIKKKFI